MTDYFRSLKNRLINLKGFLQRRKNEAATLPADGISSLSVPTPATETLGKRISLKRIPWDRLKYVTRLLTPGERAAIIILMFAIVGSVVALVWRNVESHTKLVARPGGTYTEGAIGQPRFVNPILATSDIDLDVTRLVYSGLMKFDEHLNVVPDLAESYTISDDKKTYTFTLRTGALWNDNQAITADDVVFTIQAIQNESYQSPLRSSWQGVQVQAADSQHVVFVLPDSYTPFLSNTTVGILPKHLWQFIPSANVQLAEFNIKPVGSGPYIFDRFEKDSSGNIQTYTLRANPSYYGQKPNISKIVFNYYIDSTSLLNAFKGGKVQGVSFVNRDDIETVRSLKHKQLYNLGITQYQAVFFNQNQSADVLKDSAVRQALSFAVDRDQIINDVYKGLARPVYGPILVDNWAYSNDVTGKYPHDVERAKSVLDAAGWKDDDNNGVRSKNGKDLAFELTTSDFPDNIQLAQILTSQWSQIGATVTTTTVPSADIQRSNIRPRKFDGLLFGEILGADPDPYPFWDSTQIRDPGLNLALYKNKDADKLLEEARTSTDQAQRQKNYIDFQNMLSNDIPAVFLVSPDYVFATNDSVHGISGDTVVSGADRFNNIVNWYVKTKRVGK